MKLLKVCSVITRKPRRKVWDPADRREGVPWVTAREDSALAQRAAGLDPQEVRGLQGVREFVPRKVSVTDKLSDRFGPVENHIEGMERFSQLFLKKNKPKLMKNEVIINRENKNERE